jgi:hypothetical protein
MMINEFNLGLLVVVVDAKLMALPKNTVIFFCFGMRTQKEEAEAKALFVPWKVPFSRERM